MNKLLLVLGLTLAPLVVRADDSLVRFDGGIGVDPVSGIVSNAPASNVVRGIPHGGFPWVIKRLHADVKADGRVQDDVLTPTPPSPCDSPALLIATPGTHHWFAAGIPKADDDLKP